jgi:mannonate dehydratase
VFGLPRVVSTEADAAWILGRDESRANGLTLCTGAFGAHPGNDLPAMFARFSDRVHFLHLRNVTIEDDGSFYEDDHLAGRVDMVEMVRLVLAEEARRAAEGRTDAEIPFRPDHGHELGPDIGRGTHPGYPLVGRLKGLAELRGVISAVSRLAA